MKKFWRKSASLALAIAMAGTLMSSAAFAQEAEEYDVSEVYYDFYDIVDATEGDSVLLEAQAYDYTYEFADLSDSAFTFEWYKVLDYYGSTLDDRIYDIGDILGTESTYTIDSLTPDDLSQYSCYYCCMIYKNGTNVASSYYYINDKGYYYSGETSEIFCGIGNSLTLEAQAYDYMGDLADLSDSAFTFEWYKELDYYDSTTDEVTYDNSDILGTESTYTIDSLSSEDIFDYDQLTYYYCDILKNGYFVARYYAYIDSVGDTLMVRRGNTYYINYTLEGGDADVSFVMGLATDQVLVGDWDGDGIDSICLRRGNICYFMDLSTLKVTQTVSYGRETDEVLVGDWDGDGKDSLAMRRDGNVYYFCNDIENPDDNTWRSTYGRADDEVLVGDWEGSGYDSLAARRNGNIYYLSLSMVTEPDGDIWRTTFGRTDDEVLVGDWDGDETDSLGMRRNGNVYYISNSISDPNATVKRFTYGRATDEVYVGKWTSH